jgi:hypothetical protein
MQGFNATRLLAALAIVGSCFASAVGAQAPDDVADRLVARRMTAFYEVYTGRKLTPAEVRQVTREFVQGHAGGGMDLQRIQRVAGDFGAATILLREDAGHPASFSLRHQVLEKNYFRRDMQGTLELRLMTEPDPVRIADARSKRLMTESDVVAFANLHHFVASQGAPRHRKVSRRRIDELVSLLERSMVANGGTIPQFWGDAGAYWAGVRQHWPYFDAQQRNMARDYAARTWRVSMPVEMYASLWGLDRTAAMNRWTNDVSARIRGRADSPPGMQALRAALDSAFDR